MGYEKPSPIQEKAIPVILNGQDMIGQAKTGTGKTAAFGLAALNKIEKGKGIQMVVIAPTRELASQVASEIAKFGLKDNIKTAVIVGQSSYSKQLSELRVAEVVVATPGRLLDLLKNKKMKGFDPSLVVLDEADEMLDMGFLTDIQDIFNFLPTERQTMLFSATMPPAIKRLADKILKEPVHINVIDPSEGKINKDIQELFCIVKESERNDALLRLIDAEQPDKAIVFCRTKREVDRLASMFSAKKFQAKALHGDIEQRMREKVIADFHKGVTHLLIATDVAARGLDVTGITHIFNFHLPEGSDSYVHRIGRTGRAGKAGIAITLVNPGEMGKIQHFKKVLGSKLENLPVPTLSDVKTRALKKLLDRIQTQEVFDDAADLLQELNDQFDSKTIAEKFLSFLLDQKTADGPEEIGFSGADLQRLLDKKYSGGGGHSRGGFRGRGGGGGGFRGGRGRSGGGGGRSGGGGFRRRR